jgi:ParB family chromosome partitioning protein
MQLEDILLEKIDLIQSFNVRIELGEDESRDLEESIRTTDGNIQPILVCKKKDRFELISGERRFKALKDLNKKTASCIVYDGLTDLQKSQLMYNENLGRKNLSWKEEVRAIKKLKTLGFDISAETIAAHKKISKGTAWNLLEALQAIEEFPDLINEKSRKNCIDRYNQIKKLEKEKQDGIRERKITIKEALTSDKLIKQKNIETMVIEELKQEVNHYKEKLSDIYSLIRQLDKVERLSNGVWLANEIKQLIEAARSCETFGMLDEKDKECIECQKQSPSDYAKCEFYRDEFEINRLEKGNENE